MLQKAPDIPTYDQMRPWKFSFVEKGTGVLPGLKEKPVLEGEPLQLVQRALITPGIDQRECLKPFR